MKRENVRHQKHDDATRTRTPSVSSLRQLLSIGLVGLVSLLEELVSVGVLGFFRERFAVRGERKEEREKDGEGQLRRSSSSSSSSPSLHDTQKTKERDSLDTLVLLDVTHMLTTTQPDHASNAPLRGGKRRSTVVPSSLSSRSIVLSRVGDDLGLGFVLTENTFEEFDLLLLGWEDETWEGGETVKTSDDFEGVSLRGIKERAEVQLGFEVEKDGCGRMGETNLIDQELLSLCRVEHLGRVLRDERVEEGVKSLVVTSLGSKDST